MKQTKRNIVQDYNENKRRKLQDQNNKLVSKNLIFIFFISFRTLFENLPNEIFYEIIQYFDIYHVHQGFFNLKQTI